MILYTFLGFFLLYLQEKDKISFTYFAIFDGHAGTGAALMASHLLHTIIQVHTTMNHVIIQFFICNNIQLSVNLCVHHFTHGIFTASHESVKYEVKIDMASVATSIFFYNW